MVLPGALLPLTVGTEFTAGETGRHSKPRDMTKVRPSCTALLRHERSMDKPRWRRRTRTTVFPRCRAVYTTGSGPWAPTVQSSGRPVSRPVLLNGSGEASLASSPNGTQDRKSLGVGNVSLSLRGQRVCREVVSRRPSRPSSYPTKPVHRTIHTLQYSAARYQRCRDALIRGQDLGASSPPRKSCS